MAGRASGFLPHIAPIMGSGPVTTKESPGGEDLLNHYFMEALIRRLEELESREHERNQKESERKQVSTENFDAWLRVPAIEQDTAPPANNKYTRERAIASYRKIAGIE